MWVLSQKIGKIFEIDVKWKMRTDSIHWKWNSFLKCGKNFLCECFLEK